MSALKSLVDFLTLKRNMHKHCETTSFLTYFAISISVLSGVIFIRFNSQFSQNILVLFGLASIGGTVGLIFYRVTNRKWPFK